MSYARYGSISRIPQIPARAPFLLNCKVRAPSLELSFSCGLPSIKRLQRVYHSDHTRRRRSTFTFPPVNSTALTPATPSPPSYHSYLSATGLQSMSSPLRAATDVATDAVPGVEGKTASVPLGHGARKASVREAVDDESYRWTQTLENVIDSVVSIRFVVTRNFDTWQVGSYTATGFIVDVENGIILTNKHVVTDAPFVGKVSFRNSEEVAAWPAWRDPVHDFGFLRFDSSKVKFMKLSAISLDPDAARVGLSVRVPGSDAGEKLAVLSGIIARIDRPAANYGTGTYCDFNTFYIQASANTSGGSSGSPVVDIDGKAVALNAGGSTHAASSFFLPLHRVARALALLLENKPIPRGTLQVEFVQKQYDEARRLGLPVEFETRFRTKSPDLGGLLAVKNTIPGGPADGLLFTGDLIIKVGDSLVDHFVEIAQLLDDASAVWDANNYELPEHARPKIRLTVFRDNKFLEVDVNVDSLHRITPDRYVEIGGSILHPLSYQLARSYHHPVGGVFVADAGHMLGVAGIASYSIVTSVAHKKVPTIDEFVKVMKELPSGKRVPVRYYSLAKKNVEVVKIAVVENKWGRFRMAVRNDPAGIWSYTDLPTTTDALLPAPRTASYVHINPAKNKHSRIASAVLPSLCVVESHAPFGIDGHNAKWSDGVGFVVDHALGLVMVDRTTVPTALGRLFVTFANNLVAPARIAWMHPVHNVVFVRYDKSFLSASGVGVRRASLPQPPLPVKTLELSPLPAMTSGDEIHLVTINVMTHIPRVQTTHVKAKGYFMFGDTAPPKTRIMNWDDAITLQKPMCEEAGVLVDDHGRARGAWLATPDSTTYLGMGFEEGGEVRQILETLRVRESARTFDQPADQGPPLPLLRCVDAELTETYFWKARELGLSERWIHRITMARAEELAGEVADTPAELQPVADTEIGGVVGGDRYTVITVRRIPAISGTEDDERKLKEGDLILSSNGKPATSMRGELMSIVPGGQTEPPSPVAAVVLREGEEIQLQLPRILLSGAPVVDAVQWGGAIFQMPHRSLFFHVKRVPKGCYISLLYSGTPAQRDHLSACWFVVEVDGHRIASLDDFLVAVEGADWRKRVPIVNPISDGWQSADLSTVQKQTAATPDNVLVVSQDNLASSGTKNTVNGQVIKATVSRSFRFRLVSLEQVHKVVTVDMDLASKNYWPTWRCVVDG
ncbi:serine protease [Geranomyces variabilis]|nr:serine protease [Geranomyces variabilis]